MTPLNQPVQTMIARDFSLNMEVSLMYVMYHHKLRQIMIARDFSPNMEVKLMIHEMFLHQPT